MHGIGNDYIYFDAFGGLPDNPSEIAVKLSNRHTSVGGDGVIFVASSERADGAMRIFNADGSEGKMCGNGIRCVGKFLYEIKKIHKNVLKVETLSGVKTLSLNVKQGKVECVQVDMGRAELHPEKLPALLTGDAVINKPLKAGDAVYNITLVSMGNPHCVTFVERLDGLELEKTGPQFECHAAFPERINTEFVKVLGNNEIAMRVWERGSGEAMACGTGACAAAVASVLNGYAKKGSDILVHLRGGDLIINYTDEAVLMTGGAEFSFTGEVEL